MVTLRSPPPESAKVSLVLPCDRPFSLNPSPKGQVQQWGSVHRKKDKKHQNTVLDPKDHNAPRDRADPRGGRGRGGRGRGRGGTPRGGANGHRAQVSGRADPVDPATWGTDNDSLTPASKDEGVPSTSAWGSDPTPVDQLHDFSSQATSTGWGESTSGWGADTKLNGTPSPVVHAGPFTPVPGQLKPIPKKPATSKLSWAQVARCVPFRGGILFVSLIKHTVRKRNPPRLLLPAPCNCNQPPFPLHLLVYPNSHSRSKKLPRPQNSRSPYQPLGKNQQPCKSRHGKKNPSLQWRRHNQNLHTRQNRNQRSRIPQDPLLPNPPHSRHRNPCYLHYLPRFRTRKSSDHLLPLPLLSGLRPPPPTDTMLGLRLEIRPS